MIEKYDEFKSRKKSIDNQKEISKNKINREKKKIDKLNKKKIDIKIQKLNKKKNEKIIPSDVGGSNYY